MMTSPDRQEDREQPHSRGLKLPPIAYFLLIAHFIFFAIVGSYAFHAMNP